MAALSPTNAFAMLAGPTIVYHFTHGYLWQKLANLNSNDPSFARDDTVAKSDTDVWVTGTKFVSAELLGILRRGTSTGPPGRTTRRTLSSDAEILAAALGSNGVLYVVGSIIGPSPNRGIVWAYDGSAVE